MNQILFSNTKPQSFNNKNKSHNKSSFYIIIFITCIFFILICIYYGYNYFKISNNNYQFSESLSDTIRIQALYNYNISKNDSYPIIGQINIDKINLNYPIFSYTNDNLLKLGICKVSGPNPNGIGNLCLAGHNFNNNKFFSNLYKLNVNDVITIYDSYNLSVDYIVYSIFEVSSNNTSILNQNNLYRDLTLITCNNLNKNRIVVKAKEIE